MSEDSIVKALPGCLYEIGMGGQGEFRGVYEPEVDIECAPQFFSTLLS